jgi:hypothetical protein
MQRRTPLLSFAKKECPSLPPHQEYSPVDGGDEPFSTGSLAAYTSCALEDPQRLLEWMAESPTYFASLAAGGGHRRCHGKHVRARVCAFPGRDLLLYGVSDHLFRFHICHLFLTGHFPAH